MFNILCKTKVMSAYMAGLILAMSGVGKLHYLANNDVHSAGSFMGVTQIPLYWVLMAMVIPEFVIGYGVIIYQKKGFCCTYGRLGDML